MDQSTQIWVLGGAVTVMSVILAFIAKLITQKVIGKIDNLIEEVRMLRTSDAVKDEMIKSIRDTQVIHANKLNDHTLELTDYGHRILRLEIQESN